MRAGLIGTGVVVIGMIVLVSVAGFAGTPRTESSTDTRQQLTLPRTQRNEILAEMRQMLGSLRGILYGLEANDMATVERAARVSGMEGATEPQLQKKLPEGFLKFRLQTHKGFDSLAAKAKAGGTREDIIKELAALTNNCVGCHNAYRVVEAR
ncbi:MAG: hypothetical protein ACHQ7N_01935 [Candidatus Methylomirabilales bacterium]